MPETFIPGSYWTPDRAEAAAARMSATMNAPEMQALLAAIAASAADGGDPAAAAATAAEAAPPAPPLDGPIDPAAVIIRRGRIEDVPALVQLIVHGELPPLFIEEFVEGFCVAEHRGQLIACGGNEYYGPECAVIRSVVAHERARGLRLGGRVARLLVEDARAFGAKDIYLFTMHAADFWRHIGFRDHPLDRWRPEVRVNWQYIFCSTFLDAARDVKAMWMPA